MAKSWKELDYAGVESYIKDSLKALWEIARNKEYEKYPERRPFTIEATEDGTEVYFRQSSYAENYGLEPLKVDVSTDGGQTWREMTASSQNNGAVIATMNAGEKIMVRGNNPAYGYYDDEEGDSIENCNFLAYKPCYVYGNIMSLVSKEGFEELRSVDEYAFVRFFSDYDEEFDWSWVLSKEGTPLLLPATTLAEYCYAGMFSGCTSLTAAPALPATTLASNCYDGMFYGCSNLSYIKALFTTTPSTTYTQNWVSGVKATGTFVKSASATWNVTGANGVPSGWTIETE